MSKHMRQQSITRDIERDSKSHIAASLIELTVKFSLALLSNFALRERDIELCEHMAWRKCHKLQVLWVPRAEDDSSVIWIVLQLVNNFGQLINTLPSIVCLGIHVLGTEMSPLEAIYRSQVSDNAMGEPDRIEVFA